MQVSHIHTLQHEPDSTGPENQICGLSEPKSPHLYTLYTQPLHTVHPAQSAGSYDLSGELGHECLKLLIQSNCTAQNLTFSHLMPHCRALPHHMVVWQVQEALGNVANLIGCSMSRSIAWIHSRLRESQARHTGANGLTLTNFLDCNTRHIECSTCTTQQRPQQLQQRQ